MKLEELNEAGPIAFQGEFGAYSDQMARMMFPGRITLPCFSFEEAMDRTMKGEAAYAVIPVENSLAGRVADVHHLLPNTPLYIIGEGYLPIRHCLLGLGTLDDVVEVHSHTHALPQCRQFIKENHLKTVVHADTAGAAKMVAENGNKQQAAIASKVAADVYDLNVIAENIQDNHNNYTRFLIFSRQAILPAVGISCLTTLLFKVKDIPSALYKALGCFAENNVQLTKIESYRDVFFNTAEFLCDIEGHPDESRCGEALAALAEISDAISIIGTYPKSALPKE